MSEAKYITYANNKILYHLILVSSFILAVRLMPVTTEYVAKFVENTWLQLGLPYVASYVIAIYVLPELGFMIAKSFMDD